MQSMKWLRSEISTAEGRADVHKAKCQPLATTFAQPKGGTPPVAGFPLATFTKPGEPQNGSQETRFDFDHCW